MARTTEEEVRVVIEVDDDIDLTFFIEAANALTDRIEECAIQRGLDLTEGQLKAIETYLTAHLYSLRDPLYKSKTTERASASFFGTDNQFLEAAKQFDTSGCLESFGDSAGLTWLGKPPSAQIDYVDRD